MRVAPRLLGQRVSQNFLGAGLSAIHVIHRALRAR
jgi:hypothetical protein